MDNQRYQQKLMV